MFVYTYIHGSSTILPGISSFLRVVNIWAVMTGANERLSKTDETFVLHCSMNLSVEILSPASISGLSSTWRARRIILASSRITHCLKSSMHVGRVVNHLQMGTGQSLTGSWHDWAPNIMELSATERRLSLYWSKKQG